MRSIKHFSEIYTYFLGQTCDLLCFLYSQKMMEYSLDHPHRRHHLLQSPPISFSSASERLTNTSPPSMQNIIDIKQFKSFKQMQQYTNQKNTNIFIICKQSSTVININSIAVLQERSSLLTLQNKK